MNEYVRYENMRYEMAECAEVTRQVLGLTVPVSLETLIEAMKNGQDDLKILAPLYTENYRR